MKGLSLTVGFLFVFIASVLSLSGLRADPQSFPAATGKAPMSVKQLPGAPRCGSVPAIVIAGLGRIELAQSDVGDWCSEDRYCQTGYFCCGSGCCAIGANCCERDEGCCPGDKPIGCGPSCYRNSADAEADGCYSWEVCGAPVR